MERVEIALLSKVELAKKEAKRRVNKIEFDSDGSIDLVDEELAPLTPGHPPYHGKENVRCAFCQKYRADTPLIKELGPYYGPFENNSYCHLLCAIWSPNIFLKRNGLAGERDLGNKQVQEDLLHLLQPEGCRSGVPEHQMLHHLALQVREGRRMRHGVDHLHHGLQQVHGSSHGVHDEHRDMTG